MSNLQDPFMGYLGIWSTSCLS